MNAVVLDTTIIVFLLRRDPRFEFYRADLEGKLWVISFQVVAECLRGALAANWSERRIGRMYEVFRSCVVYPPTTAITYEWAVLMNASRTAGYPLSSQDAWIAATAKALSLPLLTHDSDFHSESCPGIQIIRYSDTE